jgi:uncharacterized membrane protein
MVPAILGLMGAFVYGSVDFLGGLASRRINSMLATALAAGSGLLALAVALPFIGGTWSPEACRRRARCGLVGKAS